MTTTNLELTLLERKVRASMRSLDANSLWVNGENEAAYLMSGRSTELIDQIMISYSNDCFHYAKLYGVVASDQKSGRYCYIYLHYKRNLWKCYSIKGAFDIAEKLSEHDKLEQKFMRLKKKIDKQIRVEEKRNAILALN
jgi:hypothetical protein